MKMMLFKITTILVIFVFYCSLNAQEPNNALKLPIINGAARHLPRPDYSNEAKDFCADGKVEVEVEVSEKGNVLSAKAISGDELLIPASLEAAKAATFNPTPSPPIKIHGRIVYNFDSRSNCVKLGVVNKKATKLPKPATVDGFLSDLKLTESQIVEVEIIIDVHSGKVLRARAMSGHPLLIAPSLTSARAAEFAPTFIDRGPLNIKASLVYKYSPDGTVEF